VDPVNRQRLAPEPSQQTSLSAVPTVVVAAHVIDRLSRRTPTPMIEQAITAILDAMPDLVRATPGNPAQ
ncbi:hypothetical protein, partial [Salmonella enterica]|uniref:hypothetical protein n=1 Tax=Salmonella enterica TaxID=28901 RepID=UPI0032985302